MIVVDRGNLDGKDEDSGDARPDGVDPRREDPEGYYRLVHA